MHIRGNSIVTDRTGPDRTGPDRHTLNPFYLMKTGLRRSLINSYVERYTTYLVGIVFTLFFIVNPIHTK